MNHLFYGSAIVCLLISICLTAASFSVPAASRQDPISQYAPPPVYPEDLEAEGNALISQGRRQEGLNLLRQAADLYRARGQYSDEQRVLDRIQQLMR